MIAMEVAGAWFLASGGQPDTWRDVVERIAAVDLAERGSLVPNEGSDATGRRVRLSYTTRESPEEVCAIVLRRCGAADMRSDQANDGSVACYRMGGDMRLTIQRMEVGVTRVAVSASGD